jgi:glycosyltransferase involved in cell wall biosynthesis
MYTGTAEVIRNIFIPLIQVYGYRYDIAQIALFSRSLVADVPWQIHPTRLKSCGAGGYTLDPADLFGQLTIPEIIQKWVPDLIFLFNDPQIVLGQLELLGRSQRTIVYVTFDGVPVPRKYAALAKSRKLITMSEFSKRAFIASCGVRSNEVDVLYAPINTELFCPWSVSKRNEARKCARPEWMAEGAFVLGWVGRNQWRKQIWVMFEVISLLRSGQYCQCRRCGASTTLEIKRRYCAGCGAQDWRLAKPQAHAFLWIHIPRGKENGDWSLPDLEQHYGLKENVDLYYTQGCDERHHLSTAQMAAMYQMWDCLLFLSGGEGFGMPVWEAMSCGLPIVYSDYSSHAELVKNANGGLSVNGVLQPEARTDVMRFIADVYSVLDRVNELIADVDLRMALGRAGRNYVKAYSRDKMAKIWHATFESALA